MSSFSPSYVCRSDQTNSEYKQKAAQSFKGDQLEYLSHRERFGGQQLPRLGDRHHQHKVRVGGYALHLHIVCPSDQLIPVVLSLL